MTFSDTSFGPSALATPANAVTITRLLLAIPLLMLIADHPSSWPATALWIILCITDGIDGYLARRQGATRSGAFLDPLADKVLVLGAMIATGSHQNTPAKTRVIMAPSTSTLSASGSRKAPDRVAPWRRAR